MYKRQGIQGVRKCFFAGDPGGGAGRPRGSGGPGAHPDGGPTPSGSESVSYTHLDIIDTAISPLSLGTSHMPTESPVAALQGTDYDTGLDLKKLNVCLLYTSRCV